MHFKNLTLNTYVYIYIYICVYVLCHEWLCVVDIIDALSIGGTIANMSWLLSGQLSCQECRVQQGGVGGGGGRGGGGGGGCYQAKFNSGGAR